MSISGCFLQQTENTQERTRDYKRVDVDRTIAMTMVAVVEVSDLDVTDREITYGLIFFSFHTLLTSFPCL